MGRVPSVVLRTHQTPTTTNSGNDTTNFEPQLFILLTQTSKQAAEKPTQPNQQTTHTHATK